MKNIKLLTATALLFAAAGAYAGTDDGNVERNVPQQSTVSQQAPAPSAAAAQSDVRVIDSSVVSPNP